MNIDIHITTCHHSSVRCRPRVREHPRSNVKEWTQKERLEISKISVESIKNFVKSTRHNIQSFVLLDDGSDMPEAIDWMNSIKDITVIRFPHRGSSAGINDYMTNRNADLIVHFEDDHIAFNPMKLDWAELCFEFLTSPEAIKNKVGVITFRSGLPTSSTTPGYYGAWGPKGLIEGMPWFNAIGNAHHIMLIDTYKRFLPLRGSSGECEASMNIRLHQLGLKNIELQNHIYMFHSHMLSYPIDPTRANTNEWNLTGMGLEYGIKDMDDWLKKRKKIIGKTLIEEKVFEGNYYYD